MEDDDVELERQACDAQLEQRSSDIEEAKGAAGATPAVHLHHIHKQYPPTGSQRTMSEGHVAVHDLCLRIRPRECFSLLGTNGAGKSTTLNMVMRQLAPSSGRTFINGQSIYALGDETYRSFGFCPQANALFDNHTTGEMLRFYADIRGVPPHQLDAYVAKWLVQAWRARQRAQYESLMMGAIPVPHVAMLLVGVPATPRACLCFYGS